MFVHSKKNYGKKIPEPPIPRYGSIQPKTFIGPPSPGDILIKGDKAAEYKNWLNS